VAMIVANASRQRRVTNVLSRKIRDKVVARE
jgi:hypothetical protein